MVCATHASLAAPPTKRAQIHRALPPSTATRAGHILRCAPTQQFSTIHAATQHAAPPPRVLLLNRLLPAASPPASLTTQTTDHHTPTASCQPARCCPCWCGVVWCVGHNNCQEQTNKQCTLQCNSHYTLQPRATLLLLLTGWQQRRQRPNTQRAASHAPMLLLRPRGRQQQQQLLQQSPVLINAQQRRHRQAVPSIIDGIRCPAAQTPSSPGEPVLCFLLLCRPPHVPGQPHQLQHPASRTTNKHAAAAAPAPASASASAPGPAVPAAALELPACCMPLPPLLFRVWPAPACQFRSSGLACQAAPCDAQSCKDRRRNSCAADSRRTSCTSALTTASDTAAAIVAATHALPAAGSSASCLARCMTTDRPLIWLVTHSFTSML